jgi:hypothetical protein
MDFRYFAESTDESVECPEIKLELKDLGGGLLGKAIVSEFELKEGQTVAFIMRQAEENEYSNKEHENAANPGVERAKELGVDLNELVKGATYLRPDSDPIITKTLLHSLEDVSTGNDVPERLSADDPSLGTSVGNCQVLASLDR